MTNKHLFPVVLALTLIPTLLFASDTNLALSNHEKFSVSCSYSCINDGEEYGKITLTDTKGKTTTLDAYIKRMLSEKKKRTTKRVTKKEIDDKIAKGILKKEIAKLKNLKSDYKKECAEARENYVECHNLTYGKCGTPDSDDKDTEKDPEKDPRSENITIIGDPEVLVSIRNPVPYLNVGVNSFNTTQITVGIDWKASIDLPDGGKYEYPQSASFILAGVGDHTTPVGDALEGKSKFVEELVSDPDGSAIDGSIIEVDGDPIFLGKPADITKSTVKILIKDGRITVHFSIPMVSFLDNKPFLAEIIWDSPQVCFPILDIYGKVDSLYTVGNRCLDTEAFYCEVKGTCSLKIAQGAELDKDQIKLEGLVNSSKKKGAKEVLTPRPNVCIELAVTDNKNALQHSEKVLTGKDGTYSFSIEQKSFNFKVKDESRKVIIKPALNELEYEPSEIELKDITASRLGEEFKDLNFTRR